MTNKSIKVLLMIMLLAGLRTTIFVTGTRKSQPRSGYRVLLDRIMALVWSAMALPGRALQPIVIRRESSKRRPLR